jgi:hypothetical protein
MCGCADEGMGGCADGWMRGWVDVRMGGCADGFETYRYAKKRVKGPIGGKKR